MSTTELEQLSFHIHAGINAVAAIQNAIADGSVEGDAWADGLWFVRDALQQDSDKLQDYVEAL